MSVPLIISPSTTAEGTSLATYRRRVSEDLGMHLVTTVGTLASGLEAERYVLADALRSDAAPPNLWDGLYVYVASGAQAGTQRRLVFGAYEGAAGALVVDYPFDAPLAVGVTVELSLLPAKAYLGTTGLNTIVNRALEELTVIDRIGIAATTNQLEYSLANYSWPIKAIRNVYEPRDVDTEPFVPTRQRWEYVNDGEAPLLTLSAGFPTGKTFLIEVARPANTRVRQSGAWGDTADGLAADSDEALYDVRTVAALALPEAKRTLALNLSDDNPNKPALFADADRARRDAAFQRFYNSFRGPRAQRVGAR